MSYVKIEANFQDHPAMVGLSMGAIGLWVCGLAYSSQYLTDGKLPKAAVARICRQGDAEDLVAELVAFGRWIDTEDGYEVAGFLRYNPSRSEAEADRARSRYGSPRVEIVRSDPRREKLAAIMGAATDHLCIYCGNETQATGWDHVMPWSRGGRDEPDNLVPACTSCNSSKGAWTPEEWWDIQCGGEEWGFPFPDTWPRTQVPV